MNCIKCSADLHINTHDLYVRCECCGTIIGNYTSFENIEFVLDKSSGRDVRIVESLLLSFKIRDYEDVLKSSQQILHNYPDSWLALTYQAVALFWLGYDNFTHLNDVLKLLNKAKILSNNNEFVLQAIELIANDLVVIASKNEIYGEDLENSLYAFFIVSSLTSVKAESKQIMLDYCQKAFMRYQNNFENLIKRDKKNYDPPITGLNNIYSMACLLDSQEMYEYFYLHGKFHLSNNKSKSYYSDLQNKIYQTEKVLNEKKSPVVGKIINLDGLIWQIKHKQS